MYAQRYVELKNAEMSHRDKMRLKSYYAISSDCKQHRNYDDNCLKCGACGRMFNKKGEMINE